MNKVNPFKPSAGFLPPHLTGREKERAAFAKTMDMLQGGGGISIVMCGFRGISYLPITMRRNDER
ncbi:MAG: hypothetical protein ACR2PR_11140 [Pseudohongiellaceae bacterium]